MPGPRADVGHLQRARSAIGDVACDAAWAAGARLDPQQTFELALAELQAMGAGRVPKVDRA